MNKDYSILVGGEAGQGSRKAGLVITKILNEYGYRTFIYNDYQSLIRGGHSFSKIRAGDKKVLSHRNQIDFLLALNQDTIKKHKKNLVEDGLIIYDSGQFSLDQDNAKGIDLQNIIEKLDASPMMRNIALIAAFAKITNIDWEIVKRITKQEFKKSEKKNLMVAKKAFNQSEKTKNIEKLNQKTLPVLTGNEAASLGAVKAGLDLYLAYPMTPATGILHYLAEHKEKFNIAVAQLENEVGIMNSAVGAAYAGARTMVGTSGGGFALMTEALSLAVQNETPVLMVLSQRMSPGSGVPTYNGQGDLSFALSAGHGDCVRFVAAPGDAEEAYYWAGELLNLSWQYQTPSILLIDKEISESTFNFDPEDLETVQKEEAVLWEKEEDYKRYKDTENGISPIAFPGTKEATVKSNSYEHNEFGITVEDKEKVEKMQEKRLRKFESMQEKISQLEAVKTYGPKDAKKAIIAWGSTKSPALEAAKKEGIKMIQPLVLQPFPEKQMKEALQGVEKIALAETNGTAQLEKLLNRFDIKVDKKILKYDARPFVPSEIQQELSNF